MERFFIVFATTFLHSGWLSSQNQTNSRGEKKDEDDPREVQIISVKNVSRGFSKTFSSPNLISETALFINYLSVSFLCLIFHAIKTSKIQLWVTSLLRKSREKHFLPPYTVRNKTQPLCKQYTTKGFFFWLVFLLIRIFSSKDPTLGVQHLVLMLI